MTETPTTDRTLWASGLDELTALHEGKMITMEVLDRSFGDEYEVERLPFRYASYDPKDDVVVIAVGGASSRYPVVLRHLINHPTEVDGAFDSGLGPALRVTDADGTTTIVMFHPS